MVVWPHLSVEIVSMPCQTFSPAYLLYPPSADLLLVAAQRKQAAGEAANGDNDAQYPVLVTQSQHRLAQSLPCPFGSLTLVS